MKSRWTITVVIIAAVFVLSRAMVPGVAQDQTEQRISGLETRVAALEAEVFGSPVASPVASPVLVATPVAATGTFITAESIEFRGEGSAVSDSFALQVGTYRVRVIVPPIDHAEHLSLVIQPAPGSAAGVGFAGLVNDYQPEGISGEFLITIYTAGEFVIAGDGNRPYTVTIEL
jgi:hypothetical protein